MKIKNTEKKLAKWIVKNRYRIYQLLLTALFLWIIHFIPYLNVVITFPISAYFLILLLLFLFDPPIRLTLILTALLLLTCLSYQLLNQVERADSLANYIYGLLFATVVIFLFKNNGQKKN